MRFKFQKPKDQKLWPGHLDASHPRHTPFNHIPKIPPSPKWVIFIKIQIGGQEPFSASHQKSPSLSPSPSQARVSALAPRAFSPLRCEKSRCAFRKPLFRFAPQSLPSLYFIVAQLIPTSRHAAMSLHFVQGITGASGAIPEKVGSTFSVRNCDHQ